MVADGDDDADQRSVEEAFWRSDDFPVRHAPPDIVWDQPRSIPSDDREPRDEESRPSASAGEPATRSARSKLLIGTGVFVAAAVLAGVVVATTGSDSAQSDGAAPGSTEVDSTIAVATERLPPAVASTTVPVDAADAAATSARDALVSEVVELDLPGPVATIEMPTEVIALTSDGLAYTLSLPSGRVRSVAVGNSDTAESQGFGGGPMIVTPDEAAFGLIESAFVILPRSGPPVAVEREAFGDDIGGVEVVGWQRDTDGNTRFATAVYSNRNGAVRYLSVSATGGVVDLDIEPHGNFGPTISTSNGTWIVNDTGGAYEVDAAGTAERIDDGNIYAAVGDHRLVRSCDDQRSCSISVVTVSTGERRVLGDGILPDDFDQMIWGMSLSPDGSAVATLRSGSSLERVIIDFDGGEVASTPTQWWSPGPTWAPDSSGVFDIAPDGSGLQFTSRTGETVDFAEELGSIVAIGVRHPEAELESVAAVSTTAVTASRPLGPTGLSIVAAGRAGGMSLVDVDAAVAQSWAIAHRLGRFDTLIATDRDVVVLPRSADPAFTTSPSAEVELGPELAVVGEKLPGPTPGSVWTPNRSATAGQNSYLLVAIDGSPDETSAETTAASALGTVIDIGGGELLGGDGRGALVIERGGDIFIVGVDGSTLLTSGELMAISADAAFTRECAAVLECSIVRIDRRSGERTTPDVGFDANSVIAAGTRPGDLTASVSPDGTVLLVQLPVVSDDPDVDSDDAPDTAPDADASVDDRWFLADTTTGRLTAIADFDAGQPVIWNADSTFAALMSGPTIQVFDRAAGELVGLRLPAVRAIGPVPPGLAVE